jgi:hypothetical protein
MSGVRLLPQIGRLRKPLEGGVYRLTYLNVEYRMMKVKRAFTSLLSHFLGIFII